MARLESKDFLLRLVLTLVVVSCPSIAQAQDYGSRLRNIETDQAYRRLLHASIFNFGGVGFAATITAEEKAFHALLHSANKIALFQRLVTEGNPEGQLYALYGLYLEDSQLFKNAAERLKHDAGPPARWEGFIFIEKGRLRVGEGCILIEQERKSVIAKIASGDFDRAFKASTPGLVY
jgi:hypothetical protein